MSSPDQLPDSTGQPLVTVPCGLTAPTGISKGVFSHLRQEFDRSWGVLGFFWDGPEFTQDTRLAVGQLLEQCDRELVAASDLLSAEQAEALLVRMEQIHDQIRDLTAGVVPDGIDTQLQEQMLGIFESTRRLCANIVKLNAADATIAALEKEVFAKRMPASVFERMYTDHGARIGRSPTFRARVQRAYREHPQQQATIKRILEKDGNAPWEAFLASKAKDMSREEALRYLEIIRERCVRSLSPLAPIDLDLMQFCAAGINEQCRDVKMNIEKWFGEDERKNELLMMEPQTILIPFDVIKDMFSKTDADDPLRSASTKTEMNKLKGTSALAAADAIAAMEEFYRSSCQEFAGRQLTEVECMEYIDRIHQNTVESTKTINKVAPRLVQNFVEASNQQTLALREAVWEWFEIQRLREMAKYCHPQVCTENATRMGSVFFDQLNLKAKSAYPISHQIQKKIRSSGLRMPQKLSREVQRVTQEYADVETRLVPRTFTMQEFEAFWPRLIVTAKHVYQPWHTHDRELWQLFIEQTNVRNGYILKNVFEWFLQEARKEQVRKVVETTEPRRMPFEKFDECWQLFCNEMADCFPNVMRLLHTLPAPTQVRVLEIANKEKRRIDAFRAEVSCKSHTYEECLALIKQARLSRLEFESTLENEAETFRGIFKNKSNRGCDAWEAAVRDWFKQHETSPDASAFAGGTEITAGSFHQPHENAETLPSTLPRTALEKMLSGSMQALGLGTEHPFTLSPLGEQKKTEAMQALHDAVPRLREAFSALFNALPETITDMQTLETFFTVRAELYKECYYHARQYVTPESMAGFRQRAVAVNDYARSRIQSEYRLSINADLTAEIPTNEPESLGEIPDIITREWIVEKYAEACDRAKNHTNRSSFAKASMEEAASILCEAQISDPSEASLLLYDFFGQIAALKLLGDDDSLSAIPKDDLAAYIKEFERWLRQITAAFLKKGFEINLYKKDFNNGVPNWPVPNSEIGISSVQLDEEIKAAFRNASMRIIKKHAKKNPAGFSEAIEQIEEILRSFSSKFIQNNWPEAIHSFVITDCIQKFIKCATKAVIPSVLTDMESSEQTCASCAQIFENAFVPVLSKYSEMLVENLDAMERRKRQIYPPPALIREPWQPQEPTALEPSAAETYWKNLIARQLASHASAFAQRCQEEGIAFPSARKAEALHAMLRHVFGSLQRACESVIEAQCRDTSNIAPTGEELQDAVMNVIMDFSITESCPPALRDAFMLTVQQGLFEQWTRPTLLQDDQLHMRVPGASWDQEIATLFTPRETLPPTDSESLRKAVEPLKQAFTHGMIQNMIGAASRQLAAGEEGEESYAVSSREFSAAWIPVIRDAVSATVDGYLAQQPMRAPTIDVFVQQQLSPVRQRTLYTRACSAAEARLKGLREQAPSDTVLTAMRRMIDSVQLDTVEEQSLDDITNAVAAELLGPRSEALLPQEHSALEQLCRNMFDLNADPQDEAQRHACALQSLADECSRSFSGGFRCRSEAHFLPVIPSILQGLRAERAAEAASKEGSPDAEQPPHILELERVTRENQLWILGWPRRRTKKDQELAGFLQLVLHWHEIALTFLRENALSTKGMRCYEEARLNAECVAMARERSIVHITEEAASSTGQKKNGGLHIAKSKVRSLFDWRLQKERSLAARLGSSVDVVIHEEVREPLLALLNLARELQELDSAPETSMSPGMEMFSLRECIYQEGDQLNQAESEHAQLELSRSALAEWRSVAAETANDILGSLVRLLANLGTRLAETRKSMIRASEEVSSAQNGLEACSRSGRGALIEKQCEILAEKQGNLATLEEEELLLTEQIALIPTWQKRIAAFRSSIGGASASASEGSLENFAACQEAATRFIREIEEWEFVDLAHQSGLSTISALKESIESNERRMSQLAQQALRRGTQDDKRRTLQDILHRVGQQLDQFSSPKK